MYTDHLTRTDHQKLIEKERILDVDLPIDANLMDMEGCLIF